MISLIYVLWQIHEKLFKFNFIPSTTIDNIIEVGGRVELKSFDGNLKTDEKSNIVKLTINLEFYD